MMCILFKFNKYVRAYEGSLLCFASFCLFPEGVMSSPTRVVLNFSLLSLYNAGNKACTTMPNIKKKHLLHKDMFIREIFINIHYIWSL